MEIIRELRACAERPVARIYRGLAAQPQAIAMWRGWIVAHDALGFARITRLGKSVLALIGEPARRPRAAIDVMRREARLTAKQGISR